MTRVQRLGLSIRDFKGFLITTGRISENEILIPGKISELMNAETLWNEYEENAEIRQSARENGLTQNGGNKNANEWKWTGSWHE